MALKSPHRIVDKNGKHTTVHKKNEADKPSRIVSIKAKPPTPTRSTFGMDRGIHWSNAKNPRLRELALNRILEEDYDMSIDDAYKSRNAPIGVVFGSRPAILTLRLIDDEAKGLFGRGHCALLALSMHDKTDLPFAVFTEPEDDSYQDGWTGHAALLVDDDHILDIDGIHPIADVARKFSNLDGSFTVMDREQFVNTVVEQEERADPYGFIDELEQLVLDDFAEFIVETELDVE